MSLSDRFINCYSLIKLYWIHQLLIQLNLYLFQGMVGRYSCWQRASYWQVGTCLPHCWSDGFPDNPSSRKILLLQNGEGAARVAQRPDNCLQCAQVTCKYWPTSWTSFFYIFHPQGGQVKEWNRPQEHEQVDCVMFWELRGYYCNMQGYIGKLAWCILSFAEFRCNKSPNPLSGQEIAFCLNSLLVHQWQSPEFWTLSKSGPNCWNDICVCVWAASVPQPWKRPAIYRVSLGWIMLTWKSDGWKGQPAPLYRWLLKLMCESDGNLEVEIFHHTIYLYL